MSTSEAQPLKLYRNVGTKTRSIVVSPRFPDSDAAAARSATATTDAAASKVDVWLVNPPTPDGAIWIRSQHRVGRRSRENMIWPQVSLAQMAALLSPTYTVRVVDANAERMDWKAFDRLLKEDRPKYYVTQLTAPTFQNDLYGTFLAKAVGAKTMAFGTHVTPMPRETLRPYPTLDFALRGEPDLTLRDLIDHLEGKQHDRPAAIETLFSKHDPTYRPSAEPLTMADLSPVKGLVWRNGDDVVVNPDRPYIADLDDLPDPHYHLLPLKKYRMPLIKGPYAFVITSRGCPAGCTYCIKHVSYGPTMRLRSPDKLMSEIRTLVSLGIKDIHMYADLFTVNRDQVIGLCERLIAENLQIRWTCNSRVDFVDQEMLDLMAKAGCHFIAWGLESGNAEILAHARKGVDPDRAAPVAPVEPQGGHPQLGLLHHRAAGRDRRHHQADDRVRQEPAPRHRAVPRRGAVSRHAVLPRGRGKQLVPAGHAVGRRRHGRVDGARLPGPVRRAAALLAEARVPRVGPAAAPDADLPEDALDRREHDQVGGERGSPAPRLEPRLDRLAPRPDLPCVGPDGPSGPVQARAE